MKKQIKYIFSTMLVGVFLFIGFGSGESILSSSSGPAIEKEQEIKEFIKGKWQTSFYELGTTWYYRFEITDTEIKYWSRFGQKEWPTESDNIHNYELSHVISDTYGAKFRSLFIEETDLGLSMGGGLNYENGCLTFKSNCLVKNWE